MFSRNILGVIIGLCLTAGAREFFLKGGILETLDDVQVETFGEDMNFCFAHRFSDGSIHMDHSKGVHTVTEYPCCDLSTDNGRTWQNDVKGGVCGINSFEGLDRKKYNIGCWDLKPSVRHTITRGCFEDGKMVQLEPFVIDLPYSSMLLAHRDVLRTRDGKRLIATFYGKKEGAKKSHSFLLESTDEGRTWQYLSTVAEDLEGKTAEGPDETTLLELKSGRFAAFYRDNGGGHLKLRFSDDGCRTWGEERELTYFNGAASPHGIVLRDGTVLLVSGRPNVYLLIDFEGTCERFQKQEIYRGSGSSYASVLETGENEIMIIYDESNFGGGVAPTAFSRIHASRFRLTRNAALTDDNPDPRSKGYDCFFAPVDTDSLKRSREIDVNSYKRRNPADTSENQATYEVINIPERPHPVLRLVSHGVEGNRWPVMYAKTNVMDVKRIKVGAEFRLGDSAEPRCQMYMAAVVGANESSKGLLGYARFATDRIEMLGADNKPVSKPFDIGTVKFHSYVLMADAESGLASLYVDGAAEPFMTVTMPTAQGRPAIGFGDGSGDIYGSCDLSYFGWKLD